VKEEKILSAGDIHDIFGEASEKTALSRPSSIQ
jgi:hypothetical protein